VSSVQLRDARHFASRTSITFLASSVNSFPFNLLEILQTCCLIAAAPYHVRAVDVALFTLSLRVGALPASFELDGPNPLGSILQTVTGRILESTGSECCS